MSWLELAGLALLALLLLGGALGTVLTRNLVHSVLCLALVLVATAGLYARLLAGFLAGVQVLLYAGGVATLMIFGVMLTSRMDGRPMRHESRGIARGALAALALAGLLGSAVMTLPLPREGLTPPPGAREIGAAFLTEYVLAFEVLSVLLVAAMVAAIVIARKSDA
jgi:NADH-quinone oxidoreductase subunit J